MVWINRRELQDFIETAEKYIALYKSNLPNTKRYRAARGATKARMQYEIEQAESKIFFMKKELDRG